MLQLYVSLLILALQLSAGYPEWKLAFNIHGADGHNFGYASRVWQDYSDVGNVDKAFSADYKSYDVTSETANFIAIVRHQNGVCDAARVWEFLEVGKTLQSYLDFDKTSRKIATYDHPIYNYMSPTMVAKELDPIFSSKGGLVFNWWYNDNAVRIGNSNNYCGDSGLPGEGLNSDDFWGLGNDGYLTKDRVSTGCCWFDVGVQNCENYRNERIQGSDHGSSGKDGTVYGQYAIYVSDQAKEFPCENFDLQISFDERVMQFFRIDKGDDNLLSYDEVIFSNADTNKDNVLSTLEYSDARADYMFGETETEANVLDDFDRVDKNHDGFLTFLEIAFDCADVNKDGNLSITEYAVTRAQELLGGSGTYKAAVEDFHRIDKDGDETLIFTEVAFDAADANKDGELSVEEYSLANAEEKLGDRD